MNRAEKRRQQKLANKVAKSTKHAPPAIPGDLDLAVQHHSNGRLPEARQLYRQILQDDPNQPVALHLLGTIALQTGNFEEAAELITKALNIQPDYVDAHNNLGLTQHKQGHLEQAISSFDKALSLKANFAEALCNKGVVLGELGRVAQAIVCFQNAVSLKEDYMQAHFNLGNALKNKGDFEQAVASYDKAIAINPAYVEAYINLGIAQQNLERSDQALASYRKALEIKPDYIEAHSSLIFTQDLMSNIDQAEQQLERQRWNEKFIVPLTEKILPPTNQPDPDRRLRIGYVSADFRRHSACMGFSPLIMDHDRQNFDVFCYDASLVHDDISEALRGAATQWRDIRHKTDEQVAAMIRQDAIDILFDLSGHSVNNRLGVFAYKPAPLQVSGIGHLAPGLSTIDYRLTTPLMTPPREENIYPESPIYLDTYCGYALQHESPPLGPAPYRQNGFITFGFLGRFSKAPQSVQALWASILRDVPNSRLLLKFAQLDDPAARQRIKDIFRDFGIAEERLVLLGRTDQRAHILTHNRVDIVFDTFPHGGGITTMDSLWMGVPVIGLSLPNKIIGRSIDFICQPVGLDDWVARSPEQYYDIALQWAGRPQDLEHLRQNLRARFAKVYGRFNRDVEKSYRLIWKRWCDGHAASPLHPLSQAPDC